MGKLSGKTAVVTGASSGIGRAIAVAIAEQGATVIISGRDAEALEEVRVTIEGTGANAHVEAIDVRDSENVRGLVQRALDETGRLDIFVNNAGVSFLGSLLSQSEDQWRSMLDTNVLALLVGTQAAVAAMRAGDGTGHIVNVSSIAALSPDSGVYGATKHAVNVITNTLREELRDEQIKVTSVMPGLVATNLARYMDPAMIEGMIAMSGIEATFTPGERLPDEVLEGAQAALADFMIRPEDIASAVIFALTEPAGVQVTEIAVRPNKPFDL